MLLNLRALAFSNNMPTNMETTRTGFHFAPLKHRKIKLDVTTGMTSTYPGETLTSIPQEERAGDQGTQSENYNST
jgi:hypothetical protein